MTPMFLTTRVVDGARNMSKAKSAPHVRVIEKRLRTGGLCSITRLSTS